MEATQVKPAAVNPKLVVPFVNSVRSVFTTMVGVETTVERPMLKPHPAPSYDVSGIIGFSGAVVGSVVVSFQREAAIRLVESFAGVKLEPETPDFADAIGELANMIAGAAKKDLGSCASITTPSVVIGHGHHIARLKDVPCLIIPVKTAVGNFAVEVCIKQVATAA
jgi:chemotaxis protein CheX